MTVDLVISGLGAVDPAGFDHRTELGVRGYKYLPPASRYLLGAAKRAIADAGGLGDVPGERRAAAIGTNSAAAQLHASIDRTVLDTGAQELSPILAPFFSINLFGGRLATDHRLQGFGLTLTSPRTAGLEALALGGRSVAAGRADRLVAGAVEEALDPGEPGSDRSERGAVAFVVEPAAAADARGKRPLGRCRVHTAFLAPQLAGTDRPAALLRAALDRAGDVPVCAVLDDSSVGTAVAAALRAANPVLLPAGSGCLAPMSQVAAALLVGAERLVVTAAPTGNLAFALVTNGDRPC